MKRKEEEMKEEIRNKDNEISRLNKELILKKEMPKINKELVLNKRLPPLKDGVSEYEVIDNELNSLFHILDSLTSETTITTNEISVDSYSEDAYLHVDQHIQLSPVQALYYVGNGNGNGYTDYTPTSIDTSTIEETSNSESNIASYSEEIVIRNGMNVKDLKIIVV